MEEKSITVGVEFDRELMTAIRKTFASLGHISRDEFLLGGSQEVAILEVEIDGRKVTAESETYVGITISGPPAIVDDVVEKILASPRERTTR